MTIGMSKRLVRIIAMGVLMVIMTVCVYDRADAYILKEGRIHGKVAVFAWGSNIQTSGSVIRTAWETARRDWASAAGISLVNDQAAGNILNSWNGGSDGAWGVTTATVDSAGYIVQFTALINNARPGITAENVARSVANHEIGHLAGLYDMTTGAVIMNVNRVRSVIYTPQSDDINGVAASYSR